MYGGTQSTFLEVHNGVPQGSIVSPLLFSTYIALFPSVFVSCKQHYYADDVQLYLSFYPSESLQAVTAMNFDLNGLNQFSANHSLKLNPQKTTAIVLGRRNDREYFINNYSHQLHINNNIITFTSIVKDLGLYIDQDLRFSYHVSQTLKKAYLNLRLIYQNRHFLNRKIRAMLCDSLVLSHSNYCDTVYGPCLTVLDSNRLQRLQNACLRLIYGIRKFEHISHKLNEIGWLNMQQRRRLHSACQFFSIISQKTPPYLYNKIRFRCDVHNINVRFRGKLTIPTHSTEAFKRSFSYNVSRCLNELPIDYLKQKLSKRTFKYIVLESIRGA